MQTKKSKKEIIDTVASSCERLQDFFKPEVFKTVSTWDGGDFLGHVTSVIDNAIRHIESYSSAGDGFGRLPAAIDYYRQFPKVFEYALSGKRSKAYQCLVEQIIPKVATTFSTFRALTHHHLSPKEDGIVYRMRVGSDVYNTPLSSSEMFHIPFEKRHLIGNNRYSLSGFPCLYFGSSAYGCWEEMGRPNIESCFISRFDLIGHHFIDLTVTAAQINESLKQWGRRDFIEKYIDSQYSYNFEYLLSDYLYLWPVIFCSSIKTFYHSAVFKPEYIFPQLMLEWVVSAEPSLFDGIKFTSTKTPMLSGAIKENCESLMVNYVLPARQLKKSGLCEENVGKIMASQPISYGVLKLINPNGSILTHSSTISCREYKETIFGILENELSKITLNYIA